MTTTVLRKIRTDLGILQRRLADVSGVPRPYISLAETGRYVPSDEQMKRLRDALREHGATVEPDTDLLAAVEDA